jgi:glycosyltransferase involved in cell wall biosynthesis
MGDDAQGTYVGKNKVELKSRLLMLLTLGIQPFVRAIISKSPGIERIVYRKRISHVIPNGVQMNKFRSFERGFRDQLGLQHEKRYVLFLGNPDDSNKNMSLVKDAVKLMDRKDVELLNVFGTTHDDVVRYFNSVDVFVLCSFAEGSANVVKEAMACNCPMVVTNAGDAAWIVGETPGCFVSSYDPAAFAEDLGKALEFSALQGRTNGRERLKELGLDSDSVAVRIKGVYEDVLQIKRSKDYTMTGLQYEEAH